MMTKPQLGDRVLYYPRPEDPVPEGGPYLALVVSVWPQGPLELEVFVPRVFALRRLAQLPFQLDYLPHLLRWRRDGVYRTAKAEEGHWSPMEGSL